MYVRNMYIVDMDGTISIFDLSILKNYMNI
jgi:hypothetical protein